MSIAFQSKRDRYFSPPFLIPTTEGIVNYLIRTVSKVVQTREATTIEVGERGTETTLLEKCQKHHSSQHLSIHLRL